MGIVAFGPARAIGVGAVGKPSEIDFSELWRRADALIDGIEKPGRFNSFGICRCSPGAPPGAMEYVAAFEATEGSPIPDGMIEVRLPAVSYLAKEVPGLPAIGRAWQEVGEEAARLEGFKPYCGPEGCGCAEAPSFELYPPDFTPDASLWLYVPLRVAPGP